MKALRIGNYRQRVTVQLKGTDRDSFGQIIDSWTDQATYWAEVIPTSAKDVTVAGQQESIISHIINVRHMGDTATLSPSTHRLVLKGRILGIVGVRNLEERNRINQFTCREIEI